VTLIDSSVWIEYWRYSGSDVSARVGKLIKEKKVCIIGIILTEILQGAKTKVEMEYLDTILADIPRLPLNEDVFIKAAEISYQLKRTGKTVNTIDAIIAAAAVLNHTDLFTLDKHFKLVQQVAHLKLTSL